MGKLGGARPGAGVKKGQVFDITLKRQEMKKILIAKVGEHLDEILEAQWDLAKGLRFQDSDGHIYTLKPDPTAAKLLIEHAIGKPEQPLIGGDDQSNPIKLDVSIIDLITKVYGS